MDVLLLLCVTEIKISQWPLSSKQWSQRSERGEGTRIDRPMACYMLIEVHDSAERKGLKVRGRGGKR